ncbi:MAG: ATP-dependent Clp protease ATP-binding subunit ClpA [Saprospiraceae bacterium]|jgi:ATP-dependent Clp protease ATP-binding subunit ClpA
MEKITYPLLYFQLNDDAVLGILVGTNYQVVDKDLRNVKSMLTEQLQNNYRKHDDYPYMDIIKPKMKVVEVKVRPTYREESGAYPLPTSLKVPIVTVYGETKHGYYECYLPMFEESFYYYEAKQFQSLVSHFAMNYLNQQPPNFIYKQMTIAKPQLDEVILKIKEKTTNWGDWNVERQYETLTRLAERYPYSKKVRRNISAFPEAAWELDEQVAEVVDRLVNNRANVLIVGKSGTGKTSVLRQAIKKITSKSKQQLDFSFWQIMPQRITASAKYLGEWQEACEALVGDLSAANGILWVVDFIRLLQVGGDSPEISVAAFLTPFLQEGKLQIIGEATPEELESIRRLLPGFVENFQIVQLEELPETKIYRILDKFAAFCHQNLKIDIDKKAIELSYRLLVRYYPYQSFPGKAVRFLGQCVSAAQIATENRIDTNAVITNFVKSTGLPELFLRDDMLLKINELTGYFESKIIGQKVAIEQLTGIIKIFKAGLNNPYKPIATMIFAGPTGVGKTASAKALADYFFGVGQERSPLIRIDMSEFQHVEQIARFIGAGKEVGKLVQDIRERPFSVLLLDEVEKADPAIFDAFLSVLDEGMLVDAFGRITNFRNTIIIMTTNLGASNRQSVGFGNGMPDEATYNTAIAKYFRPEFVNRIDSIVMFNPLNAENIQAITIQELHELKQREGFTKIGLKLEFSEKLLNHLASVGFDERYGARPLQRAIEREVVAPLAQWILGNPKIKNTVLKVDYEGGLKVN